MKCSQIKKFLADNWENIRIFVFLYVAIFTNSSFVYIVRGDIPVHVHILCLVSYTVWPIYIAALGWSKTDVSFLRAVLIGALLFIPGLHQYTIIWYAVKGVGIELPFFAAYLYLYLTYLLYYCLYRVCKCKPI